MGGSKVGAFVGEEGEAREGGLIGIAGKPFQRHLQKGKHNQRGRQGDQLHKTETITDQ